MAARVEKKTKTRQEQSQVVMMGLELDLTTWKASNGMKVSNRTERGSTLGRVCHKATINSMRKGQRIQWTNEICTDGEAVTVS